MIISAFNAGIDHNWFAIKWVSYHDAMQVSNILLNILGLFFSLLLVSFAVTISRLLKDQLPAVCKELLHHFCQ